jgi:soluble lytic murein transglycosylase-like protein
MFNKYIACTVFAFSLTAPLASAKESNLVKETDKAIFEAANITGVPAGLLISICWHESGGYRSNLSEKLDGKTPSYGICQVKLETAAHMDKLYKLKGRVSVQGLRQPFVNAFYAGLYLKYQMKRYKSWSKAVAAYNKGHFSDKNPNSKYIRKVKSVMYYRSFDASVLIEDGFYARVGRSLQVP